MTCVDDECVQPRKKEFDRPVKTMKMDTASSVHASDTYDKEQGRVSINGYISTIRHKNISKTFCW